jgi:LmbE family N-acetylglucosaminyl deacetylase
LTQYQGRRPANPDEEHIAGYVGLQNALTHHLRRVRPDRVLVPAPTDLHPDHQITHNELMISLFHAAGAIWPELGAPLAEVPKVYEMAIYCDFDVPPNLELRGSDELFDNKLKSIAAYRSQEQIARIVDIQRASGPYEYLREVNFRFYSPERYKHLFA